MALTLGSAGLDEHERLALADDLGCHEEARAGAWEAWQTVLELEEHDVRVTLFARCGVPCGGA
ncbi:hypothetical protein SAMN00790413_03451 [Deinococcus hopiensis KR-140]|uniref:Uncharacterized protein n=1 Tax=Deinococcus hopiensis KR-140 TaxID=695939 RepID=A0A1W1UWV4_9DEIO|nr:hypothetical protein SAMN00790413_03451 [Deinococcus hopiensis KR-140]